ncbi:hypothetical protein OUZ56_029066 [Daphnia magna]|uniref:Uncharacterized protein n=1 Tax=Daphnia magna TaxID=35525 RepID=A0ABR0B679_9CRUS|nr:hypothetical protein OUZ56_029066 [Daphnia magna]
MAAHGTNGRAPKRPRTDQDNAQRNWYGGGSGERGGAWEEDGGFKKKDFPENHILLFTIVNPVYPITVDVLHTITQAFGEVLRIVIFKKHGVQAMVEYPFNQILIN